MKVSVCITVFNEERSVGKLLNSLLEQTKKPDEIVIVDGGSNDKTVNIIRKYAKKHKNIKLIVEKSSRAEGRNTAVKKAGNSIIAMTDADCKAKKNWLKKIINPLIDKNVDIVAGFYDMKAQDSFQKAEAVFLGVLPEGFDEKFLPSTRSIAFRKKIWKKIGGFPEGENNSAEDTDFNYQAVKIGAKFARVKSARVEWEIPNKMGEFAKKIFFYAKWDASYGIWWHPVQKYSSHNIKAILIFTRYVLGVLILLLSIYVPPLFYLVIFVIFAYIFWSFNKVYSLTSDIKAGLWGIIVQFVSDFAVMGGFISGLFIKSYE